MVTILSIQCTLPTLCGIPLCFLRGVLSLSSVLLKKKSKVYACIYSSNLATHRVTGNWDKSRKQRSGSITHTAWNGPTELNTTARRFFLGGGKLIIPSSCGTKKKCNNDDKLTSSKDLHNQRCLHISSSFS